jgi:hypothetical protein
VCPVRSRKIRAHHLSPAAAVANPGDDRFRFGFAATKVNQNLGASFGKRQSGGAAYAAGSSCYESGFAREIYHDGPSLSFAGRSGIPESHGFRLPVL